VRTKIGGFLAAVLLTGTTVIGTAGPAVAAPRAYSDCPRAAVCFYTGSNGTGSMCSWEGNDSNWTAQPYICSWATTHNVKSIYNHGSTDVRYWTTTGYEGRRKGCTRDGVSGNLAGTYKVLSHNWGGC
jgi:hypothetical protein